MMTFIRFTCFALVLAAFGFYVIGDWGRVQRTDDLNHVVESLRSYYATTPIRNDWQISEIVTSPRDIEIRVLVPGSQAAGLVKSPQYVQFVALGAACPDKKDPLWQMVDQRQDISVRGKTATGEMIMDVSCRLFGQFGY
ncbi:MAG: hypothetical protein ACE5NW_05515 [Acidiferrobacterales bacterium]